MDGPESALETIEKALKELRLGRDWLDDLDSMPVQLEVRVEAAALSLREALKSLTEVRDLCRAQIEANEEEAARSTP